MKKFLVCISSVMFVTLCFAQSQMPHWVIGPKTVNVLAPNPLPATINPATGSGVAQISQHVANGWYDATGNLIFYICDNNVYDYNNTYLGSIPNSGSEVAIVPFGDNSACQYKFNLFSTHLNSNSDIALYKTILDMTTFDLQTPQDVDHFNLPVEFGCIAVGTKTTNHEPLIYFMAATGTLNTASGYIDRLTINIDGTVSSPTLVYPTATFPNNNSGPELLSKELDLSPDGQWLGWSSFHQSSLVPRYHVLKMDANGDVDGTATFPYQQFSLPNTFSDYSESGFRGVEFYQDALGTKLFVGAGLKGIEQFYITMPVNAANFTSVANSAASGSVSSYGYSQIEWANNGNMYANSNNITNNVGGFDPVSSSPSISTIGQPSFSLSNNPSVSFGPGDIFYTLPDQIDGQDYSLYTSPVFIPVMTVYDYVFNTSNATWIYNTAPWNTALPVHVIHLLTIAHNCYLTIDQMTFEFNPNASTVIQTGGTLNLRQSVFTGEMDCDKMYHPWLGVNVQGTSYMPQNLATSQGKFYLTNSTIQFANIGAKANNNSGGIIQSTDSKFLNCNTAIFLAPYQSLLLPNSIANKCKFVRTDFEIDQHYPFSTASTCVLIDGVTGIKFNHCTFEVTANNATILNLTNRGIVSNNSSFSVFNNSVFTNLHTGIDAMINGGTKTFTVTKTTFNKNQTGIQTTSINHFRVTDCTFNIGNDSFTNTNDRVGLNNHYGSGFTIQANHFTNPTSTSNNTIGIITNNTGAAQNMIRGNAFSNLHTGNLADGQNRMISPLFGKTIGLQYWCNTNYNNIDNDFEVDANSCSVCGIRLNQGSTIHPANNTFSATANSNFNNNATGINYYWQIPNQPTTTNGVTALQSNSNWSCSPFPALTLDGHFNPSDYNSNSTNFHNAETDFLNLLYTYNTLIDGGNTNALLNEIENSWSQSAQTMRDELMAESPYLSEDVLRGAALTGTMPQAMLLTVLLANPDATRSEDFLEYLQEEIPNPLPEYMIELIVDSWSDQTPRTALENMMADASTIMGEASDHIISNLYYDETLDEDSITESDTANIITMENYWLQRTQTTTSQYEWIENEMQQNNFTIAEAALQNISTNFNLSEEEAQELTDYTWYYNFRKTLKQNNEDLSNLDSMQQQTLTSFATSNDNRATQLSKNALCFYYGWCEDTNTNGNRNTSHHYHGSNKTNYMQQQVCVYPNPTSDGATFIYQLPNQSKEITLNIYNNTGTEIFSTPLSSNTGTYFLNTASMNNGFYFYQIATNNEIISHGKLTINK